MVRGWLCYHNRPLSGAVSLEVVPLVPNSTVAVALQAQFLTLLPRLQNHGQIYFRHLNLADQKQDAIQEMVALAWKWFLRLHQRGKDIDSFPMVFIFLVAKAVQKGRKLCGQAKAKDVLNPVTQRRHGFTCLVPGGLDAAAL